MVLHLPSPNDGVNLPQLIPFPQGKLFVRPIYCVWEASTSICLQKVRKKVDDHAEKATRFFIACQATPDTKVNVTEGMGVKGYSNSEAANLMLQMQVHRGIVIIKEEVSPCPKSVAALLLGPGKCNNDWPCPPQCNCLSYHHCCS